MPDTFTLIAATTVGAGGAATIDFTSIPNTYTDLCLKWSSRAATGSNDIDNLAVTLNNTTTGYTQKLLYGYSSSVGNESGSSYNYHYVNGGGSTANTFGNGEIYIPNYAGSANKFYSADMVTANNIAGSAGWDLINATRWANTAAINRITLQVIGYNHAQHSTAYLYGIVKQ
jgi:hypothetical protein